MPKPSITRPKRNRIDSASEAVKAFDNALAGAPKLPPHLFLRPHDVPFWDNIMRGRARDEWARSELDLAWQLARCQGDIWEAYKLIDGGDRKAMDAKGFPSVKALNSNVNLLTQRQSTLLVKLRMAGNMVGDPMDEIPRRRAEREAEKAIEKIRDSGNSGKPPLLAL